MSKSLITTHILDTELGKPACDVVVKLYFSNFTDKSQNVWELLSQGLTNKDGRCASLLENFGELRLGKYKLAFEVGNYFLRTDREPFFEEVEIIFKVKEQKHHHVPLLLSRHSYTTYRGS